MQVLIIGRAPDCDMVIPDPYVSKHHMQLVLHDNGAVSVVDLNSRTGTFVNGRKIRGEHFLQGGETIKIGRSIIPWEQYVQSFSAEENEDEPIPFYKKRFVMIGMVALLILLIGGVGYWMYKDKVFFKSDEPEELSGFKRISTNDFEMDIYDVLENKGKTRGNEILVYENDSILLTVSKIDKEKFKRIVQDNNGENTLEGFKQYQVEYKGKKPEELSFKKEKINGLDAIVSEYKQRNKDKGFAVSAFIDGDDAFYEISAETSWRKRKNIRETLYKMIRSFQLTSDPDGDDNKEPDETGIEGEE